MLLKTFVFFSFALMLFIMGPAKAEEDILPATVKEAVTVAPHVNGAVLTPEQKEKIKAERKARREECIKAHPEQIKQMQENRSKRQQWMKEHPEEAKKQKEAMRAKQSARKLKMQAEASQ